MYYVTVLYPHREGMRFDFDYYMSRHIPMVSRLLRTTIEVTKGIGTPTGTPPVFLYAARIRVRSLNEYQAAIAQHGAEIIGDMPNYTDVQPSVQIDEVVC
ncbi:MAG TPA: EthD family reductase [Terriglobales bacterium]|jgi:uncharacterized protein (TIGR02118 family)